MENLFLALKRGIFIRLLLLRQHYVNIYIPVPIIFIGGKALSEVKDTHPAGKIKKVRQLCLM